MHCTDFLGKDMNPTSMKPESGLGLGLTVETTNEHFRAPEELVDPSNAWGSSDIF